MRQWMDNVITEMQRYGNLMDRPDRHSFFGIGLSTGPDDKASAYSQVRSEPVLSPHFCPPNNFPREMVEVPGVGRRSSETENINTLLIQ